MWVAVCFICVLITANSLCEIINGRFELYDYSEVFDFNTPTYWQRENYTAVVSHFVPNPVSGGFPSAWQINPQNGLYPYQGDSFLVLSTGNFVPDPQYAKVWQNITVAGGDKLIGTYFFGTCDYLRFDDYAEIKLIPFPPDLNRVTIEVLRISVADVNNYGSTRGWQKFGYTFDANQAGDYSLTISVTDLVDPIFETYFAVDSIVLCQESTDFGDFNLDCTTDFQDFALLAADWMKNCNDPNVFNDPNSNCRYGTDITQNGPIDANDLGFISDCWLKGIRQP